MNDHKQFGLSLMERMRRHRRKGIFLCLVSASTMSAGCYGRFPMTHALYNMNGNVENGVIRNVVFWLLAWFPIYWFAQVGDAIIFNLIEFWTGSEVDLGAVSVEGDSIVTLQSSEDKSTLFMTIAKSGDPEVTIRFIRMEEGIYEMRDHNDVLAGKIISTPDGLLNLADANGKTMRTINPAELASAAAK